jgi:hypothetical protein
MSVVELTVLRTHARATLARIRAIATRGLAAFGPEAAVAIAIVWGWAFITLGIARIARPDVVFPLSIGLLLMSLAGWRIFVTLVWHGLYVLIASDRALKPPGQNGKGR